jgi:membrane-associated protein
MFEQIADLFLHLDKHLAHAVEVYGAGTYILLALIVFCETGLVVTPILPGDSLLFAAGAITAIGGLSYVKLIVITITAAILGDLVNYHIGKYIGPKVFEWKDSRIFKQEYLTRTQAFFDKHGGKTIVLARFTPIVRTFAPFLAGLGNMGYGKFLSYNIWGAVFWVVSMSGCGYIFGEIPFVKKNFTLMVLGIVFLSVLPILIEVAKAKFGKKEVG